MLAALVSVLALAGAPGTTTVQCNPDLPQTRELGVTFADTGTIINGQFIPGILDHVELGTMACGGLLYASMSPQERAAVRRLNPSVDFDQLVGVGLQVALHEANHVALNSTDECQVEKVTRTEIDGLIERLGDPGRVGREESAASVSDAGLPAVYHGC